MNVTWIPHSNDIHVCMYHVQGKERKRKADTEGVGERHREKGRVKKSVREKG